MKKFTYIAGIFIFLVAFGSCKKDPGELTEIHQKAGDYMVSVSYSPVEFEKGTGTLFIEFKSSADNSPVAVEHLSTDAYMQMQGSPMYGTTSVSEADKPGRYKVKYNFGMKGDWIFNVRFGNGQHVQFLLSVK